MNQIRSMNRSAAAVVFVIATAVLIGARPAHAVTIAEATAFFKDLDDQLLPGRGPDINAMYLPGVAAPTPAQLADARMRYRNDLNDTKALASASQVLEYYRGRAMAPPKADEDKYKDLLKKAKDSGALDRISSLQFNIMKKHFPDAGGTGIDFAKAQDAITKFANGDLRTGAPGTREMNGLGDWYDWKNVAAAAIDGNVQKASWEKLLPSIQTGLEIYRKVYPPSAAGAGVGAPVTTSNASRFKKDGAQQFTPAQITGLANTINGLTTAQILDREAGNLKDDTTAALIGPPSNGSVAVASAIATPVPGGLQINLLVHVTDPFGQGVNGDQVEFLFGELGLELPPDTFSTAGFLTGIGAGEYETSFLAPSVNLGLWFWVMDDNATSAAAGTIVAPGPASLSLLLVGLLAVVAAIPLVGRRRNG